MFEKQNRSSPAAKLPSELRGLLDGATSELAVTVAPQLLADESFQRGLAMYRRVVAERQGGDPVLGRARADFGLFAAAHVLSASGTAPSAVGEQLGSERVVKWLKLRQVPEVLFDNDPQRAVHFIKRLTVPTGESSDFAYLLGAHAGTRRLGSMADSVNFTSGEEHLLDRVSAATLNSCGIVLGRSRVSRNGRIRFNAGSRAHEFVEYLREVSAGNAVVPWKHIQTSAERREFIRGFLDFSGGTVAVEQHRFIIGRRHNPAILEEVAIVMKREGLLGRVKRGQIPSLHVGSYHGLSLLRELNLVNAERIRKPLEETLARKPEMFTGQPEQYRAVMAVAERLERRGTAFPEEVRRILELEGSPARELSLDVLRQWVRGGHVPASVVRLQELDALEHRLFPSARIAEIGAQVEARLGTDRTPRRVVRSIAEFLGGAEALALATRIPQQVVEHLVNGIRLPTRAEYRFILETVGLSLGGELEQGLSPPEPRDIERWLKTEGERKVFGSYRASIGILARDAFSRGEDPREAVRERLMKLMRRNSDMIIDESR